MKITVCKKKKITHSKSNLSFFCKSPSIFGRGKDLSTANLHIQKKVLKFADHRFLFFFLGGGCCFAIIMYISRLSEWDFRIGRKTRKTPGCLQIFPWSVGQVGWVTVLYILPPVWGHSKRLQQRAVAF